MERNSGVFGKKAVGKVFGAGAVLFACAMLVSSGAWGESSTVKDRIVGSKVDWNVAELVFLGEITLATPASRPPSSAYRLRIDVVRSLRGDVQAGDKVEGLYFLPEDSSPAELGKLPYPLHQPVLMAAQPLPRGNRKFMTILRIELAEPTRVKEVQKICSLPYGWRMEEEEAISPWATLGPKAWQGDQLGVKIVCAKSGRPALLAGDKMELKVEPVLPATMTAGVNPNGDGEFKITVSNPTNEEITVPALLAKGETVLWANSLVILWQGKAHVCPDFQQEPGPLTPVVLKPGQSVSGIINVLKIPGKMHPADHVFVFCLGEKSAAQIFTYTSPHHDEIRRRLLTEK